jgi:hypothetical protein
MKLYRKRKRAEKAKEQQASASNAEAIYSYLKRDASGNKGEARHTALLFLAFPLPFSGFAPRGWPRKAFQGKERNKRARPAPKRQP